jgi:hypothetical protein
VEERRILMVHRVYRWRWQMAGGRNAPTNATWLISLILFVVALCSRFGIIHLGGEVATWSWIIGYGLLLVACKVRGL